MDTLTYAHDEWIEGNPPLFNARTHATWLSSVVFDGARAFEGVTPDLDLHCARLVRSRTRLWVKADTYRRRKYLHWHWKA